jgi:hypothetical protein
MDKPKKLKKFKPYEGVRTVVNTGDIGKAAGKVATQGYIGGTALGKAAKKASEKKKKIEKGEFGPDIIMKGNTKPRYSKSKKINK